MDFYFRTATNPDDREHDDAFDTALEVYKTELQRNMDSAKVYSNDHELAEQIQTRAAEDAAWILGVHLDITEPHPGGVQFTFDFTKQTRNR